MFYTIKTAENKQICNTAPVIQNKESIKVKTLHFIY